MKQSSSFFEKHNLQFEYAEALMLIFLALQYLKLWLAPDVNDAEKIFQFSGLMAFEFIMVHSGVFMAAMPKKVSLFVLVPIYGLFAIAFNSIIGGSIIAYVYLITVFNRMRFAFFNASPELKKEVFGKSALATIVYFFLVVLVAIGNAWVPEFGLADENLTRIGYDDIKDHGGLFLDEPQTAISCGFLYYSILAFFSVMIIKMAKGEKKFSA